MKITKIYKAMRNLKSEGKETIEMFNTYYKLKIKKETLTPEEINSALEQLGDVKKMSLILPLVCLPMSYLTIPIAYKIAKKMNKDLTPSSFKENNDIDKDLYEFK